jgi:hypothetical protein
MGYFVPETAPAKSDPAAKNRVRGFFGGSVSVSLKTRRAAPEPHLENYAVGRETASGIPYWPSRDPIGERGGVNLYGFVGNNPADGFDLLGLVYPEVWRDGEDPPCKKEQCHNIFLRIVAISGNTTRGDRRAWNKTGLQIIDEDIDSNQELVDEVKKAYDEAGNAVPPCRKCIKELHLSGHGAVGGVNWVNSKTEYTNFDTSSLTQSQVDLLKGMLCDDGVLRLWSCSSAILPDAPGGIAAMAKLLGVKVSGIADGCANGPNGGSHDGVDVVWRGE